MSKEVSKIVSKLIVKTFLHDDLTANHRDRAWEEGQLYLMLDPENPVVRHHRLDRIVIPDECVMRCLGEDGYSGVAWTRFFASGAMAKGTLLLVDDQTVRLIVKLSGSNRSSGAPEGRAMLELSVAEISRYVDVQKRCLPMAGRAYRSLRSALHRGSVADIGFVERGLDNRLWQLGTVSRCKNESLRDVLIELMAVNDEFIEAALEGDDPLDAIELIRLLVEGNASLKEELAARVQDVRARIAEEKERKSRAITTVADMQEEKERVRGLRKALKAKRAKRTAADATISAESAADKVAAAMGFDPDDDLTDLDEAMTESVGAESSEVDDREVEGSPEAPPTPIEKAPAPGKLSATAQRMFRLQEEGKSYVPAPKAPKPTETAVKKVEAPKLTFSEKIAARRAAIPAASDSAPAETAPAAEAAQSE